MPDSPNKKKEHERAKKNQIERFTAPIYSFPGKPPTPEELKMIEEMKAYISTLEKKE